MKTMMAAGLAVAGMLVAGCGGPIPAWQDPYYPLQVSLSDTTLQEEIRVHVLPPEQVGRGQLRVTLDLFNDTGEDLAVDYTYWFTDAAGREVEAPLTQGTTISPHGYMPVVIQSMGTGAGDFRVQLRPHE